MTRHPGGKLLASAMTELGFRKRAGLIFTLGGDGDFVGWLGLNTASRAGRVGELVVNPIVGVRHRLTEEWVAQGRGDKLHGYVPTYASPLKSLEGVKPRLAWMLDGGEDDELVLADISRSVSTAGMRFISDLSDLEVLVHALEGHADKTSTSAYRWVVAMFLAGDQSGALNGVAMVRDWLNGRDDRAAEELRLFLTWFAGEVRGSG